ncbi:MAG: nucleotide-binding domain containing protein [Acidobacteriota bacterium]
MVGSRTRIAREQAERLEATGVERMLVPVAALLDGEEARAQEARVLEEWLAAGKDVLVTPESHAALHDEQGAAVARAMARLVVGCADTAGGLVATGGETARAVLDGWGVERLRVLGEVEPGVAFSMTDRWRRALPVVTKAGGFGNKETLMRCREFLKGLQRGAGTSQAEVQR